MIHLIDPRYTPPPIDMTRPLGSPTRRPIQWMTSRHMHGALLVAVRQRTGLWRVIKACERVPPHPIRRKTLERMVLETIAKVEELS